MPIGIALGSIVLNLTVSIVESAAWRAGKAADEVSTVPEGAEPMLAAAE